MRDQYVGDMRCVAEHSRTDTAAGFMRHLARQAEQFEREHAYTAFQQLDDHEHVFCDDG
jgi:hypothetical protein